MCSVEESGNLYTWFAFSEKVLAAFDLETKFSNHDELDLVKLNENQLAISTGSNAVTILKHEKGAELTKLRHCQVLDSSCLSCDLASHDENLAVLGTSGKVEVWNYGTAELVGSFKDIKGGGKVGISDNIIVVSNWESKSIRIYGNGGKYKRMMMIDLKTKYVHDFTFITSDYFMVTSGCEGIFFVSLAAKKFSARCKFNRRNRKQFSLARSCILPDGRICAAGPLGDIAVFEAPESLRAEYKSYAETMNP